MNGADDHNGAAPLTRAQEVFWTGQQLAPDAALYNMGWRFDLLQAIDPERFSAAFSDVVMQHDGLRLVFAAGADGVRQRADAAVTDPQVIDLSGEGDPDAAATDWITARVAQPFDLSRCGYDTALLRLGASHWVWFFNQHHLTTDAAAAALIFAEVSRAYEGLTPDAAPSFLAHANAPDADDLETARAHWQGAPGAATSTPLYGGAAATTPASVRVRVPVPVSSDLQSALTRAIDDPATRVFSPQLTEFALLFTAFAAYVHRVTGDERVSIGAPTHNRLTPQARQTIGLFVETFPLDIDVTPADSFTTLYGRVKTAVAGYLRHARPGASSATAAKRISAVINYITASFGEFAGAPARATWMHPGAHDPRHSVRLHAMRFDGEALSLAMDINDTLAAKTQIADIPDHFARMLQALLSAPETPIGTVPLCPADAVASHGNGRPEPEVPLILNAIAAQPADAVAVRKAAHRLTYGQVQERAAVYCSGLAALGVAPGDRVLVHCHRTAEVVSALLGILSRGASFVPVAANTPDARVREIADLAGITAIIADAECATATNPLDKPTLPLGYSGPIDTGTVTDPTPNDTAYVLFTSGSTGTPKGVEVTHAGLARYIAWAARAFGGPGPADYALFSSLSFDLTITSIFAPLTTGGAVAVYPETGSSDLAVLDVFADDAVDVVKLTPSHLSLVCAQGRPVSRIRSLVLGGENLTTALSRRALDVLSPDIAIANEYGPTEGVVGAMIHRFDPARDTGTSVPIGRPADGVQITVRDAGLSVVPMGVVGEICISGRLAKGYLKRPDLTAERFVDDPQSPGTRLYRTGDLGRLLPSGVFDYLGRSDDQLKVGGVRVEPAEIDAALNSIPGIRAVHIHASAPRPATQACTRCGLPDSYPDASFRDDGLCAICAAYDAYKDRAQSYFQTPQILTDKIDAAAAQSTGDYDLIMLLSGGKDSTYAAYRLAEHGKRVLALTLDNGYISEGAMANIRRVADDLGWDHRFMQTDAMNAIFVESLKAHSNVCQGCFKAIYTLALRVARDEGVAAIVTGLSRGQFFETRLTPELFNAGDPGTDEIEHLVDTARRQYHAQDDAVSRLLCADDLRDGSVLDQVSFLDLYRYIDVPVSEIYRFLGERAQWIRPDDTGRSTNCLINDVGIYVHTRREGFHNYALPYSWDVRLGHKTRDEAVDELNDEIDEARVTAILSEIGFDEDLSQAGRLVAYVVADPGVEVSQLWEAVRAHVVPEALPTDIVLIDAMPLTPNGKVDTARLPKPTRDRSEARAAYRAPVTADEERLTAIFAEVLGLPRVGVDDNFYDIGGDSLAAIQIAILANEAGLGVPATAVFEHPTIARLAGAAKTAPQPAKASAAPLVDLDEDDLAGITRALS